MTGTPTKRFLDPKTLTDAAVEIAAAAHKQGAHVALIGGFAMQVYGSDRLTGDLDVVADARLKAFPRGTALSFGGEQTHAHNGVPVDVVLRRDIYTTLYDEALAHAVRVRGLPLPIVRLEHLAAMKMAAGRPRDEGDLAFLVTKTKIDTRKTLRVVRLHMGAYAGEEFTNFVEVALWEASRRKT
jgi:hypothetical protein